MRQSRNAEKTEILTKDNKNDYIEEISEELNHT
jgi:hypothetical protein